MVRSTLALADDPRIDIVVTSARPIINADAVAAVRRGLRSEFWPARLPTVPNSLRYTTAAADTIGRLITGLAAATPSSTPRMPTPTHQPPDGTSANSPVSIAPPPARISAAPPPSRQRRAASGIATSSRSAAIGGIFAERLAGMY